MQVIIPTTGSATYRAPAIPRTGAMLGFGNMLKKEMRDWFSTRRWLIVGGVSTGIIVLFELIAYLTTKDLTPEQAAQLQNTPPPTQMPIMLLGSMLVVAAIIVTMGEVVEEKKSGTAAWIMSKPASRIGFILSKWIASVVGVLLLTLVIPGVVGVALGVALTGESINVGNYAAAFGLLAIYYTVFVSISILLGTFMPVERAVSAGGSGLFLAMSLLGQNLPPAIMAWVPISLTQLAQNVIVAGTVPSFTPVIGSVVVIIASVVGACYVFGKQEL